MHFILQVLLCSGVWSATEPGNQHGISFVLRSINRGNTNGPFLAEIRSPNTSVSPVTVNSPTLSPGAGAMRPHKPETPENFTLKFHVLTEASIKITDCLPR